MKVLLVEDEEYLAKSIKKGLENHAYLVDVAYDGEVGYDLASSEQYDLIILDRMLPKRDGMSILADLRKNKSNTPILMLTAKTMVADRVAGLELGADDYLGKPFAFAELLARIRALTRRKAKALEMQIGIADLLLNISTRTATRNQKKIDLSPKEFALLEFLITHKGRVFDKDELARRVWRFDDNVLPNTAQVYIGYLRNKIDRAFPQLPALIRTVRGFGYMIGGS